MAEKKAAEPLGVLSPEQLQLEEITKRATEMGPDALTEQDRVQLVAHRLIPTVVASQRVGKIPKEAHPWDVAVRIAIGGFRKKYGREPAPNQAMDEAGPAAPTTVQMEMMKRRAAVQEVVVKGLTRTETIQVPKDPRQRAPTREVAATGLRDVAGVVKAGIGLHQKAERTKRELAQLAGEKLVGPAVRAGASMYLTGAVLIPARIFGLISDDELNRYSRKLAGTKEPVTPAPAE